MIASRTFAFVVAAIGSLAVLAPVRSDAQWWRSSPVDFESCADVAEKAKTKEEKTAALAECNAEIRRPPQARRRLHLLRFHAGPDLRHRRPEPDAGRAEENRRAVYRLSRARTAQQHRRGADGQAATGAATGSASPEVQQVSLRTEQASSLPETEKVPVPVASPVKQAARIRAAQCAKNQFSCEWPRLSESINELKRLFNPQQQQPTKQKKS